MKKSEIVDIVAKKHNLSKKVAVEVMDTLFATIIDGCKKDGVVDIPKFGKFEKKFKEAGVVKAGGKEFAVESKHIPKFKFSKVFREEVK